jgi:hypothetical protein
MCRHCDRDRVRASGLWKQNHIDESYDPAFLDDLERLVGRVTGTLHPFPIGGASLHRDTHA